MVEWEIPILANEQETLDNLKIKGVSFTERITTLTENLSYIQTLADTFDKAFESLEIEQQQQEEKAHEDYPEAAWDLEAKLKTMLGKLREKEAAANSRRDCLTQLQQQRQTDIARG
ncbi:unnamed protein product [Nippostrongylus brasiliensis]|uniref:Intraflagellar transport protein 57 homolog n=1 Tax=Nippostrongylus brasiliensis TaxID=27835 RepID=A0A0N4XSG5_NIPBR|nr:unnamed protein product [Nippostrongylus brasiliensis]